MQAVTKFQAIDGAIFDTAREAAARDALETRLAELEAPLGPRVGYGERKRHAFDVYRAFRTGLVMLARELHPREAIFQHDPMSIHPFSFAGRFLDDAGPLPLNRRWARLMCITDDGTEYEQPYFALNPGKFEPRPEATNA